MNISRLIVVCSRASIASMKCCQAHRWPGEGHGFFTAS
jgi:hypothetical protein